MAIKDTLVGDSKVRVETDSDAHEYEIQESGIVDVGPDPREDIVEAIEEKEFTVIKGGPRTITQYIHDEPTPYDSKDIAEELNLDEDHDVVNKIANVGSEIKLDMKITNSGDVYLTHVNGVELVTEKEVY